MYTFEKAIDSFEQIESIELKKDLLKKNQYYQQANWLIIDKIIPNLFYVHLNKHN